MLAMTSNVTVKQVYIIENLCNAKSPWTPKVHVAEDRTYCLLAKWDTQFCRFVTGKPQDLRAGVGRSISCSFFDQLISERCEKSKKAVLQAVDIEDDDAPSKRPKKRRVKQQDQHLAPPFVTITLPPVEHEGVVLAANDVRALWNFRSHQELWVEMTPDTLEHIRLGILSSMNAE